MELAEVKKYFENAEFVETKTYNEKRKIDLDSIWIDYDGDYFCTEKETGYIFYLGSKKEGFVKILTSKEPSFSITKDQLRQLTDPKVKEWFPEVFEVNLEVGKWYLEEGTSFLYYPTEIKDENNINAYGFTLTGRFSEDNGSFEWGTPKRFREATNEEVFEALKNEAVKRGFVEGNYFIEPENCAAYSDKKKLIKGNIEAYMSDNSMLHMSGTSSLIYKNGTWATIIQTITKSEAEKLLNKKIID